MSIKTKIRTLLGDVLTKFDCSNPKNRIVNKQVIKNIVLDEFNLPLSLKSQSEGGFIRILAKDSNNANQISSILKRNQNELGIKSVHITDRALDFSERFSQKPLFECSVLLRIEPKVSIESIPSPTSSHLKEEVFKSHSPERVVIDFSSPNIAKPFHFGHLKSTLLGNYLSNLNTFLGNQVTKLNYVGDWGTQYGLLSLGMEQDNLELPNDSTLKYLLDVYIKANERGRTDETFHREARRRFISLENGKDEVLFAKWQKVRDLSLDELKNSYSQIGIEFDHYDCESDYAKQSIELVKQLLTSGQVKKSADGVVYGEVLKNERLIQVPVLKSDGASLYITRDIIAAIKRKERFNFDKMLYVVGSDQERHFYSLRELIRKFGHDWADSLIHVKMGKVLGMSTRSGNFVLLSEIIDEVTRRYIEATKNVPTSKVTRSQDIERTGKHLALAALFVFDLRNYRTKNYKFDWDQVTLVRGRSGIHLQTTYARLSSLLRKASAINYAPLDSPDKYQIDALQCVEGMNLISLMGELDTELHNSYWLMDPSRIVNYALALCKTVNRASHANSMQVLSDPDDRKALTKLSLFKQARDHLGLMIKLIGLEPLEKV